MSEVLGFCIGLCKISEKMPSVTTSVYVYIYNYSLNYRYNYNFKNQNTDYFNEVLILYNY